MASFYYRLRMEFTPAEIAAQVVGFGGGAALFGGCLFGWAIALSGTALSPSVEPVPVSMASPLQSHIAGER